jgi:NAD(P)-dependent dehydrogenase (short-subunit alcohol dehydrogenase family)
MAPERPTGGARTAIITGGSRGIGLAIARRFVEDGINVVVTSRTEDGAAAAAAELGAGASGFVAHAADADQASACVGFALARYGSVDILVNNAGTNPAYGPLVDVERSRFAKTVDVNLWAPLLWSGLVWRASMAERGGVIINVASIGGTAVEPNLGTYNLTKAALIYLTKQLAYELAPHVRVNAVAPGIVRTRLAEKLWREHESTVAAETPLARMGEPEDVASSVSFLAGAESSWMTGETLLLDGGRGLSYGGRATSDDAG